MEVMLSLIVVAIVFGAIVNGYLSTAIRCQWTAYSLAAQSLGMQTIEQAKSAGWDIATGKNEMTNMFLLGRSGDGVNTPMTGYTTNILDVPWKGTNYILATNYITIRMLFQNNSTNPYVQMQLIRVDTVWPFAGWNRFQLNYYTNSVCTLVAPDNRDPITLGVGGN